MDTLTIRCIPDSGPGQQWPELFLSSEDNFPRGPRSDLLHGSRLMDLSDSI
jgi:hypothetical protein